jgi:hypothetical protein
MLLALVNHDDVEQDGKEADGCGQKRDEATERSHVLLRLGVFEKVCEL